MSIASLQYIKQYDAQILNLNLCFESVRNLVGISFHNIIIIWHQVLRKSFLGFQDLIFYIKVLRCTEMFLLVADNRELVN